MSEQHRLLLIKLSQFGFRKDKSTFDSKGKLVKHIYEGFDYISHGNLLLMLERRIT